MIIIVRVAYWLFAGSLLLFCVVFALPIISGMAAREITELAGCRPPTFDMNAVCPAGSIAERFSHLTGWLSSLFAPFVFVKFFWDWTLIWGFITAVFYFLVRKMSLTESVKTEVNSE